MSEIRVDTISEKTSANGVAVDGVTFKDGALTSTAASTITTADNNPQLTLVSTDADGASGPNLTLYRNSSSPADNDQCGRIKFIGRNDNSQDFDASYFTVSSVDVSDGSEDASMEWYVKTAGSDQLKISMKPTETVFNEASADLDFRVESNGSANMLFIDAGNDHVNIGTSTDLGGVLNVEGQTVIRTSDNSDTLTLKSTDDDAGAGPVLNMVRDSASPADGDGIARIYFTADNDAGEAENFVRIKASIIDASNGSEDGQLRISRMIGGGDQNVLSFLDTETVVNDDSKDLDFRVESNGNTHMLFVDGGNNRVGIGTTPDLGAGLHIRTADSGASVVANADDLIIEGSGVAGISIFTGTSSVGQINFGDSGANERGKLLYDHNGDYMALYANSSERMRIHSDGNISIGRTTVDTTNVGISLEAGGTGVFVRSGGPCVIANRLADDGEIIRLVQAGTTEGTISVSGSTISYNAFTGSHWSRLADNSKPSILVGTIMESLDSMINWYQAVADVAEVKYTAEDEAVIDGDKNVGDVKTEAHTIKEEIALPDGKSVGDDVTFTHYGTEYTGVYAKENDVKHVHSKVSDSADSTRVYGVFHCWGNDNVADVNDMEIAQVGTYIIRVHKDVTVSAGDLLVSNGDGTAKKQDDDIIRSKTVAKVNSNVKVETYADGSYTVPCTLHC